MTRAPLILLLPAVAVFSCGKKTTSFHHCGSDSECGASQVCFPDGCGDPAQGLRVEIVPSVRESLYAQDFVVGTIANKQDFTLSGRSTIQGVVRQLSDGQAPAPYPGLISIQAFGESTVIPGIVRSFELANARGTYVLPVAMGTYSVFANASEEPLPPLRLTNPIQVSSGEAVNSDLLFPSASSLTVVSGQLLFGGQPPGADL